MNSLILFHLGPKVPPGRFVSTYLPSNPTSVQLSWNEIPRELRNGIISGYVLTVVLIASNDGIGIGSRNVTVLGPEVLFYEITHLLLNAVYNLSLVAQTSAGIGPEVVIQLSTSVTGIINKKGTLISKRIIQTWCI